MRSFLSFATLLGVAFLLGCQDQGSGPVGPDVAPQFDKAPKGQHNHGGDGDDGGGLKTGSPFYSYTFTKGGITTNPPTAAATGGSNPVLQGCCDDVREELILSGAIAGLFANDFCFTQGGGSIVTFTEFSGVLRHKKNSNEVSAVFLIKGLLDSGTGDLFPYRLILDDPLSADNTSGADEIFPPELGETTTVHFTNASLEAQSQSNRNKGACSPSPLSGLNIAITLTGTDDPPSDTPDS